MGFDKPIITLPHIVFRVIKIIKMINFEKKREKTRKQKMAAASSEVTPKQILEELMKCGSGNSVELSKHIKALYVPCYKSTVMKVLLDDGHLYLVNKTDRTWKINLIPDPTEDGTFAKIKDIMQIEDDCEFLITFDNLCYIKGKDTKGKFINLIEPGETVEEILEDDWDRVRLILVTSGDKARIINIRIYRGPDEGIVESNKLDLDLRGFRFVEKRKSYPQLSFLCLFRDREMMRVDFHRGEMLVRRALLPSRIISILKGQRELLITQEERDGYCSQEARESLGYRTVIEFDIHCEDGCYSIGPRLKLGRLTTISAFDAFETVPKRLRVNFYMRDGGTFGRPTYSHI